MDIETTQEDQRTGLGRRSVIKAAAWSVPVIAVAVAAPVAAASGAKAVVSLNLAQTGAITEGVGAAELIDTSKIAVLGASSQNVNTGDLAGNVNDNNPSTFWHTQYEPTVAPTPHWITLQGPETYELTGFQYTPRPEGDKIIDGSLNGVAKDWHIVGSADAAFTTPVALMNGSWAANNAIKMETFPLPTSLRFIRLYIDSQHGNDGATDYGSAAEIRLIGRPKALVSLAGTANFSNDTNSPNVTQATLTLTVPDVGLNTSVPLTVVSGGPQWTLISTAPVGASIIYTFNFSGSVAAGSTSPTLAYSLAGDGTTPNALPKTASGELTGAQFDTVTDTVTWS